MCDGASSRKEIYKIYQIGYSRKNKPPLFSSHSKQTHSVNLLSSDLIVTSGQVNSLAGLGNDPNLLQISAPLQPGNSGGPIIDRSGGIVGAVVSKLNVARVAKFTGDLAQNVNFAIKPEIIRLFLDANQVNYVTAHLGTRIEGTEIAQRARSFSTQVLCTH